MFFFSELCASQYTLGKKLMINRHSTKREQMYFLLVFVILLLASVENACGKCRDQCAKVEVGRDTNTGRVTLINCETKTNLTLSFQQNQDNRKYALSFCYNTESEMKKFLEEARASYTIQTNDFVADASAASDDDDDDGKNSASKGYGAATSISAFVSVLALLLLV